MKYILITASSVWKFLFYFGSFIISASNGAKILGIVPTPSYSHQAAFRELWRQFSLKGHQVTVLTTDPVNDPGLTNLVEIDLKSSYDVMNDIYRELDDLNMFETLQKSKDLFNSIPQYQLSNSQVQSLIHNKSAQFDIVLTETLYPEFLAFGELYNCPTILISSLSPYSLLQQLMGNPAHPVVNPEYVLPFYAHLSFKERLVSTLFQLFVTYFRMYKIYPEKLATVKTYFENTSFSSIPEMIYNVDMLLVSLNPILHEIRAHGPNTIYFGGGNHISPPKQLPKNLRDFLDNATRGVIYFSLGCNMKSVNLKAEKLDVIIQTFDELPYKILWKYEGDNLANKSDKILLVKWLPQQDVLRHPNIKLFISQGGLQSLEEAIFSHVPLVVLPFFGDQAHNAKVIEHKGIGKAVFHQPKLEKEEFKSAILEVINDSRYRDNTKIIAELLLDQPMAGLKKAIWWTEYVIRNKGAKHLRNTSVHIPHYQYFLIDVIGFLFVIIIISTAVSTLIIKLLVKTTKLVIGYLRENKKKKVE